MLDICLLGEFHLRLNGRNLELTRKHEIQLLAYLLINAGTFIPRETLATQLWGDNTQRERGLLRTALSRLDHALGSKDYIIRQVDAMTFNPRAAHQLDAQPLLALSAANLNTAPLEHLLRAAQSYKPLLPHLEAAWLHAERQRLENIYEERVLRHLPERLAQTHQWQAAADWFARALSCERNHYHEPLYRSQMQAHYQLGNSAGISQTYQQCNAMLDEIGLLPSKETRELYEKLLREEVAVSRAPSPTQPADAAPPQTLAPSPIFYLPDELRHPPTPLVGRVALLQELADLLNHADTQLITLLGIGGIGKTRLAAHTAQTQATQFADGMCFVGLENTHTADAFFATLGQALQFKPYGQESLKTQLTNYLQHKQLLLVLDNFESLLETHAENNANDSVGALLIEELCVHAPHVKMLVTSRQSLNLQREHLIDVEGLAITPHASHPDTAHCEALALFGLVAKRVNHRFDVNTSLADAWRICQLLGGTPLAIEIAATLLRSLSCREVAERIQHNLDAMVAQWRNVPPRQRSLRAVLGYAWSLLAHAEQRVFSQLSVFVDGFTNEAALAITHASHTQLRALQNCALVRLESGGRFQMHPFVRQFAHEKLHEQGDETTTLHEMAQYFLSYAQRHTAPSQYAALEPEWLNLMAGMAAAQQHAQHAAVLAYADALSEAWYVYARYGDIRQGMAWADTAAQQLGDAKAQSRTLSHWGRACVRQGDYAEANALFERGLKLAWQLIDSPSIARILHERAQLLIERSEFRQAEDDLDQCLEIYEELGDRIGLIESYRQKARLYSYFLDENIEARQLVEQAYRLLQEQDNASLHIAIIRLRADVLSVLGEHTTANAYCDIAIQRCLMVKDKRELGALHYSKAKMFWRQKNWSYANEHAGFCLKIFHDIGDRKSMSYATILKGYIAKDKGELTVSLNHIKEAIHLLHAMQDKETLVRMLLYAGDLFVETDQFADARATYTEGLNIAKSNNHSLYSTLQQKLRDIVAIVR